MVIFNSYVKLPEGTLLSMTLAQPKHKIAQVVSAKAAVAEKKAQAASAQKCLWIAAMGHLSWKKCPKRGSNEVQTSPNITKETQPHRGRKKEHPPKK